jgi:hypothetical protein
MSPARTAMPQASSARDTGGVPALDREREDGDTALGAPRPDEAEPRDAGKRGQSVLHELVVMARQHRAGLVEERHRGRESDRSRDVWRASLEFQRRLLVVGALEVHRVCHVADRSEAAHGA